MKFTMNERIKHRVTGVAVLLSIIIIFLPAMVKHSNRRIVEKTSVSVHLPPKPPFPKVAQADEKKMFESVKVAKIDIPAVVEPEHVTRAANAESLSRSRVKELKTVMAEASSEEEIKSVLAKPLIIEHVKLAKVSTQTKLAKSKKSQVVQKPLVKKDRFAVQLASFSELNNAQTMLNKLRDMGYKATYSKKGNFYKVVVGDVDGRFEAKSLQKKLVDAMELNGFVVKIG